MIESTTQNSDTGVATLSVQVLKGQIENMVKPQKPGGRYRITTPAAVAAVRGTEFRVSADDGGDAARQIVQRRNKCRHWNGRADDAQHKPVFPHSLVAREGKRFAERE